MIHRKFVRAIKNYKMNFVVKILILSDFVGFFAVNLSGPIFAIFISSKITGASIETVGIATTIYFVVKSIVEIPIGVLINKTKTERDDLYCAIAGLMLMSGMFFYYLFINEIWELYLSQAILGFAGAMAYPAWYTIFTRHIDRNKEAVEWSFYDVSVGLGMSLSAVIGAFVAEKFGFDWLFFVSGLILLSSGLMLFAIRHKIYEK
ncbi:MAG: MFS transporter [Patescibacteria group bacterium]